MITVITEAGRSFKGAFQYFGHDKGKSTSERVLWTMTGNLSTDDPEEAWRMMAYTASEQPRLKEAAGISSTGRKLTKPVFCYNLAWHPEETPSKEQMAQAVRESLETLGFGEHEWLALSHGDRNHPHVHLIVNRVNPLNGLAAQLSHSKRKLSEWALAYEKKHGKIYCEQRENNALERESGKRTVYRNRVIVNAWRNAKSGRDFILNLRAHNYHLAQGNKRIVVVDPYGKIINPTRHLENVRAKHIQEKLSAADLASLPNADALSRQLEQEQKQAYLKRQQALMVTAAAQNRLQSRQHEERAEVFNRHLTRIEDEQTRLEEYYQIRNRKEALNTLIKRVEKATWWRNMTGKTRKDREEMEICKDSLADVQQRLSERVDYLKRLMDKTMADLAERHVKERELQFQPQPESSQINRQREIKQGKRRGWEFER